VFGGHLLAQMLVASAWAGREAGFPYPVRSIQGIFARTVAADAPAEVVVDLLHTGRVVASGTASVWQAGSERARGLVSLSAPEPDLFRHHAAAPDVGGPDDAVPFDDPFGRELRIVGGLDRHDPAVVAPPRLAVWVRHPHSPGDPAVRQALVAHTTANFLIGTAMLPHADIGESMSHVAFSTGIISHAVTFHEDIDPGAWYLVTQESTYAGLGRSYGTGQVFTDPDTMAASFAQESISRPFPQGHTPAGREATIL
jgi:acyl-CoA thioesterase